jgi:hypothetical protein
MGNTINRITTLKGRVLLTDPGKQLRLGNVATPVDPDDAATKAYVDSVSGGGGGGGTWGSITGTLTNQTDLNTALGTKVNKSGDTMTGTLTINGASIEVASGTDTTSTLGNVKIGGFITGAAAFMHGNKYSTLTTDFCLYQTSGGATALNASLTQALTFRKGNVVAMTITDTAIQASASWITQFLATTESSSPTVGAVLISGGAGIAKNLSLGSNIILPTSIGTKIGTATNQLLGFWNATPIAQPTTATAEATYVAGGGGGTALATNDTFDGYTLAKVVKALRNAGILA